MMRRLNIVSFPSLLLLCLGLVFLFTPSHVKGLDYSIYGNITGTGTYSYIDDDEEHSVSGKLEAEANHRLSLQSSEFFAHHALFFTTEPALDHHIYEAYFSLYGGPVTITLGKQRLNWGYGYLFSPTDALHPSVRYTESEEGFSGGSVSCTPSANVSITGAVHIDELFAAEENLAEKLRFGGYASGFIDPVDMFGSFVYQWEELCRPGIGLSVAVLGFIISGEGAVELHNRRAYPEEEDDGTFTVSTPELGKPFWAAEAAVERNFYLSDWTITPVAEYCYRQWGYSNTETEDFIEMIGMSMTPSVPSDNGTETTFAYSPGASTGFADSGLLGKHYFSGGLSVEWTNRFRIDSGILVNILDNSFVLNGELRFLFIPGTDIFIRPVWFSGDDEASEFGHYPNDVVVETGVSVHF